MFIKTNSKAYPVDTFKVIAEIDGVAVGIGKKGGRLNLGKSLDRVLTEDLVGVKEDATLAISSLIDLVQSQRVDFDKQLSSMNAKLEQQAAATEKALHSMNKAANDLTNKVKASKERLDSATANLAGTAVSISGDAKALNSNTNEVERAIQALLQCVQAEFK